MLLLTYCNNYRPIQHHVQKDKESLVWRSAAQILPGTQRPWVRSQCCKIARKSKKKWRGMPIMVVTSFFLSFFHFFLLSSLCVPFPFWKPGRNRKDVMHVSNSILSPQIHMKLLLLFPCLRCWALNPGFGQCSAESFSYSFFNILVPSFRSSSI